MKKLIRFSLDFPNKNETRTPKDEMLNQSKKFIYRFLLKKAFEVKNKISK